MATQKQIDTQLVKVVKGMNTVMDDLRTAIDLFESDNDDDFYATVETSDMRSAIAKVSEAVGIVSVRMSEKMYDKMEKEGVIN